MNKFLNKVLMVILIMIIMSRFWVNRENFDENGVNLTNASEVFYTMFSQPSPWFSSIRDYDIIKQEKINKYFVSQL